MIKVDFNVENSFVIYEGLRVANLNTLKALIETKDEWSTIDENTVIHKPSGHCMNINSYAFEDRLRNPIIYAAGFGISDNVAKICTVSGYKHTIHLDKEDFFEGLQKARPEVFRVAINKLFKYGAK